MTDLVIPIVFPDYIITIETTAKKITVPDLIPFIDILPNEIHVSHTNNMVSGLGHAGVLFINGKTGITKYYEYGRYDAKKLGWVKKILNLNDARIGSDGKVEISSLSKILRIISRKAGKRGRISGAYIEVEGKYEAMLAYAKKRMNMNLLKNRESYDIISYSCLHFMKGVMEAANLNTPILIDPRPTSYIKEIQEDYPAFEYNPSHSKISISDN